jgi:hypothetical protein
MTKFRQRETESSRMLWNQACVPKPEAILQPHRVKLWFGLRPWMSQDSIPSSLLADTGSTNKKTPTNWAQKESERFRSNSTAYALESGRSPFPCAWKNTLRWAIPMLQGQWNDINWRSGRRVGSDRPSVSRPGSTTHSISPIDRSCHGARATSRKGNWTKQWIMLSRSLV